MRKSASVIVTTYNAPDELEFVLTGLQRQSTPPLEILVADDGSTETTEALIRRWQDGRLSVPLRHVWHPDRGFRRGQILNAAVAAAQGDYLVFLDGDCVPHRHFVADHLALAHPRRVLCGRRVRLGPELSRTITPAMVTTGDLERFFGPVRASAARRDTRHWGRGLRLPPWFAWILRLRGKKLMGCNFSLPRAVFESVNGFDEEFQAFGGEDYDLDLRCRNVGARMTPLINRGIVYHLYHPMKRMSDETRQLRAEKSRLRRVTCERGLSGHVGGNTASHAAPVVASSVRLDPLRPDRAAAAE